MLALILVPKLKLKLRGCGGLVDLRLRWMVLLKGKEVARSRRFIRFSKR